MSSEAVSVLTHYLQSVRRLIGTLAHRFGLQPGRRGVRRTAFGLTGVRGPALKPSRFYAPPPLNCADVRRWRADVIPMQALGKLKAQPRLGPTGQRAEPRVGAPRRLAFVLGVANRPGSPFSASQVAPS